MASRRTLWKLARAAGLVVLISFSMLPVRASATEPTISHSSHRGAERRTGVSENVSPIPVLAYYYIWFDPTSWNRAKVDYPLLGRYSSDDETVMRQHIQWAKAAGIGGFIVSWKSTDTLNARLAKLVEVAQSENFKLEMIYEGLDFSRKPLSAQRVSDDLGYFAARYANNAVFDLYGKPVMIWSGIWEFSRADVQMVSQKYRDRLLLLASEKSVQGYQRVADLVDGDAYYWSSVNPDTNSNYESKLNDMANAIHANHGLWIAPAAPGFDARLVGGTSVVDRKQGETLRQQLNVAEQASPDAIGIISWNEFSENTYIEPSQQYGQLYLNVVAAWQQVPTPNLDNFDSSDPADQDPYLSVDRIVALGSIGGIFLGSIAFLLRRQLKKRRVSA